MLCVFFSSTSFCRTASLFCFFCPPNPLYRAHTHNLAPPQPPTFATILRRRIFLVYTELNPTQTSALNSHKKRYLFFLFDNRLIPFLLMSSQFACYKRYDGSMTNDLMLSFLIFSSQPLLSLLFLAYISFPFWSILFSLSPLTWPELVVLHFFFWFWSRIVYRRVDPIQPWMCIYFIIGG